MEVSYAIAIRKADGTIVNTGAALPKWSEKYPFLKLPILRGGAVLLQSMGLGIKALNYSANEAFAEAQEAEAGDTSGVLHAGRVKQDLLDFLTGLLRTFERCSIGKLKMQEHVALIFPW